MTAVAFVFVFLLAAAASGEPAPGFVVIVNAANPATQIDREELSRLFLKKVTFWGEGLPALPVDQPAAAPIRAGFSHEILLRNVNAVRAYWQQRIFSGRALPPPVKDTADEIVRFVRDNPGAVGYVPPGTELGSGVRVLEITGSSR